LVDLLDGEYDQERRLLQLDGQGLS